MRECVHKLVVDPIRIVTEEWRFQNLTKGISHRSIFPDLMRIN